MASPFTNGHDRATAITPATSASGEAARRRMVLAHLPAVVFAAPDVEVSQDNTPAPQWPLPP